MQKFLLLNDDTWQIAKVLYHHYAGIAFELLDNNIERHTILWMIVTTDRQIWKQRNVGFTTVIYICLAIWKMKRLSPLGELVSRQDKLWWLNPVNQQYSAGNHNHWTAECDPEACYTCNSAVGRDNKGCDCKSQTGWREEPHLARVARQSAVHAGLLWQQLWEDGVCSLGGEDLRLKT